MDVEVIYNLYEIRMRRRLSTLDLEQLSGVSKSQISSIENEAKHPSVPIICKLAKALDVDARELFDYM